MKLLEYHENITTYVAAILIYQEFIKPITDKITFKNLVQRIKIVTILMVFTTIRLINQLFKTLCNYRNQ